MATNLQKLAERLKQFEDGQKSNEFTKLLWKPTEGVQNIRIVPYKFNTESPFIELKFYYNLGGKHYLAPCTFGKPDPIMETIESLRAGGSNEEKELAAKLAPTSRTYAPIIVRGKEEEGVKFWGFGVTVYKQLLKVMTNPKYGDITSWTEGRDVEVEFHKESKKKDVKTGKSFPETTILVDPSTTPVVNPTRRDLMEKLKDQTDILNVFPLKSYDELKDAVNKWLNPDGMDSEPSDETANAAAEAAASDDAPSTPSTPATTATATPTNEKAEAEFADFFKNNG